MSRLEACEALRSAACWALGRLGDRQAVPLPHHLQPLTDSDDLSRLLGDTRPHVRLVAYRALSAIDKALLPCLQQLLCHAHLTRFVRHTTRAGWLKKARWPACRLCGKVTNAIFDVQEVVAILDMEMPQEFGHTDSVARVNWLQREALFDFDRVEIVQASEYEVERLCAQVGNDTDAFRRPRYRKMRCTVDPQCRLSQSTLNMLKRTFGQVSVSVMIRHESPLR